MTSPICDLLTAITTGDETPAKQRELRGLAQLHSGCTLVNSAAVCSGSPVLAQYTSADTSVKMFKFDLMSLGLAACTAEDWVTP